MLRTQEEILAELDQTLDQLMHNASVVCESDLHILDSLELGSLHKTQESLLARFAHTQEELHTKRYEKLHDKIKKMGEMNTHFMQALQKQLLPRIGRNRRKSKVRQPAKRAL